jgi:hypothetical protein
MKNSTVNLVLAGAVFLTACGESATPTSESANAPDFARTSIPEAVRVSPLLARMNVTLAARKAHFRVDHAEWVTRGESNQAGQIVFANDRGNKQLDFQFVPGDPRRGHGNAITYLVDQSDGATSTGARLSNAQTEAAIDREMHTWETTTTCSNFSIIKLTDSGADPDVADGLLGFGGIGTPFADITHAGWAPAAFFDALAPDGSQFILGVTFTFFFDDATGNPTDIDHDGKGDAAFRETYYNDAFEWGINTDNSTAIDVETVALHESGHGLSQAHFGKIFGTLANLRLHFAPRAVMNAAVSTQQHSLTGSDMAGHCSIWGSWPHR